MNLIGLLLAALIVCYLGFTGFKSYFKVTPAPQVTNQIKEIAPAQNIDTSSYQSTLSSIRSQLQDSSQKEAERAKELEGL